jgi:hypothetical protein
VEIERRAVEDHIAEETICMALSNMYVEIEAMKPC